MSIGDIIAIAALIFGFGFVVFFHELGHFLAAKWMDIKVEQFAVGFGHAILSWRKGMGLRWGSSGKAMAAAEKGGHDLARFGETEYRFNWIPLGGYVKMLGQDDLNPNAGADDPRAYNRKSIGARMIVVSAGVIMNVILAAILFMVVFLMGFRVPPAIIGSIETNSPAQLAGLQVGDKVLYLNGDYQHDFTKLQLNAALVPSGQDVPITVLRNGKQVDLLVRPMRETNDATSFLNLGIGHNAVQELRGLDPKVIKLTGEGIDRSAMVLPGDVILTVNGEDVTVSNFRDSAEVRRYVVFDRALQNSNGKPLLLTVRDVNGQVREVKAEVGFEKFFGQAPLNLAGLEPRPKVAAIMEGSPVEGKLKDGDIITGLRVNTDRRSNPTVQQFIDEINKAGDRGWKVDLMIERGGKPLVVEGIIPAFRTGRGKRGLGIGLESAVHVPVVAGVLEGSAADRAGVPSGAIIRSIDGEPVANWFDVHRLLKQSGSASTVAFQEMQDGEPVGNVREAKLALTDVERRTLANVRYSHGLALRERIETRQTSNPLTAAAWGVTETRDLLLQFYVTLHRLTQGSVSAQNLMGPIGIVHAGSLFASRGWDWLLWFLAMISANLAVVNFLPIPIVDGGLFTFLIIEKISGRPLSPRMQTVAQLVGLAIILSVFLLVTYQDIARIWM